MERIRDSNRHDDGGESMALISRPVLIFEIEGANVKMPGGAQIHSAAEGHDSIGVGCSFISVSAGRLISETAESKECLGIRGEAMIVKTVSWTDEVGIF